MTKNNMMNVVVRSSKQQISKILRSQIISSLQYVIKYDRQRVKETAAYQILTSDAYTKNGQIASWSSDHFAFRFEYGKHHGSVRISYMNSDGLQSAIFSASEWRCMTDFMKDEVDRKICEQHLEEQHQEEQRKQREFDEAVRKQVELILKEKEQQSLQEADRRFKERIDHLQSANPHNSSLAIDDDELY